MGWGITFKKNTLGKGIIGYWLKGRSTSASGVFKHPLQMITKGSLHDSQQTEREKYIKKKFANAWLGEGGSKSTAIYRGLGCLRHKLGKGP